MGLFISIILGFLWGIFSMAVFFPIIGFWALLICVVGGFLIGFVVGMIDNDY